MNNDTDILLVLGLLCCLYILAGSLLLLVISMAFSDKSQTHRIKEQLRRE